MNFFFKNLFITIRFRFLKGTLPTSLPLTTSSSIFVRCDEERLDVMKVLITVKTKQKDSFNLKAEFRVRVRIRRDQIRLLIRTGASCLTFTFPMITRNLRLWSIWKQLVTFRGCCVTLHFFFGDSEISISGDFDFGDFEFRYFDFRRFRFREISI